MRLFLSILVLLLIGVKPSFSSCTTKGDGGGTWDHASTWTCSPESSPPGCADTVTILASDSVYIDNTEDLTGCGPMVIIIYGQLQFKTGKKLKLADGSTVELKPGAKMYPGGGGGSSNYLEIGGNQVWTAADSTQTGPKTYTSGGSSGPLPITLISFEAHSNVDKIDLKWVTAVEINNDFFTIEKSINGKDWEVVSVILGAGNSNQIREYFDVDYSLYQGISYYRLKQTDYDGMYSYSNVVPVKYVDDYIQSNISVFPSPAQRGQNVSLRFEDIFEEKVLVVLRNLKGQEYYSKVHMNIEDGVLVAIPMNDTLPSGVYLITASSENQMYSQKILVK